VTKAFFHLLDHCSQVFFIMTMKHASWAFGGRKTKVKLWSGWTCSVHQMVRCICDCVPACCEQGKVVESTTLRQSPKDTEWLTKLWCYMAANLLWPPGSPTTVSRTAHHGTCVGENSCFCCSICQSDFGHASLILNNWRSMHFIQIHTIHVYLLVLNSFCSAT
jgi:hypothetical protein